MQPKNVLNHAMPRIQAPALTDITAILRPLNVSLSRNFHAVVMEKKTVPRCTAKMAFVRPVLQVTALREKFATLTRHLLLPLKTFVFTDARPHTNLSAPTIKFATRNKIVLRHAMLLIQVLVQTGITAIQRLQNVSLSRNFHAVVTAKKTVPQCTAKMAFVRPVLQVTALKERYAMLTRYLFKIPKTSVFTGARLHTNLSVPTLNTVMQLKNV
jgi:hypothetical protein